MSRQDHGRAMKRVLFLILAYAAVAYAGGPSSKSARIDQICKQKAKDYGKAYIDCVGYDSGVEPLSMSYQKTIHEPVGVEPSRYKDLTSDKNGQNGQDVRFKYPSIAGPMFPVGANWVRFDEMPLAHRMLYIVEKNFPEGSPVDKWFHDNKAGWLKKLDPTRISATGNQANGRCYESSAMPWNKPLRESFQHLVNAKGATCGGVPFEPWELKEIALTLFETESLNQPYPGSRRWSVGTFYHGNWNPDPRVTMTANIGLKKLGVLGSGGTLKPETMLADYQASIDAGKGVRFNTNQTAAVWNHAVLVMTDTTYDGGVDPASVLSAKDLSAKPGDATARSQLLALVQQEASLIIQLAGDGIKPGGNISNINQIDEMILKRSQLLASGALVPTGSNGAIKTVKHDITTVLNEIDEYGQSNTDQTRTETYTYSSVESGGKVLKSIWTPPTTQLSKVCEGKSAAELKKAFPGMAGFDVETACKNAKDAKGSGDYEVFGGAVPPQTMESFDTEAHFRNDMYGAAATKEAAFKFFVNMVKDCPVFDRAVKFVDEFKERIRDNVLSADDQNQLAALFRDAEFLDQSWLKNNLCGSNIIGLAQLRAKLPGFNSSICN